MFSINSKTNIVCKDLDVTEQKNQSNSAVINSTISGKGIHMKERDYDRREYYEYDSTNEIAFIKPDNSLWIRFKDSSDRNPVYKKVAEDVISVKRDSFLGDTFILKKDGTVWRKKK